MPEFRRGGIFNQYSWLISRLQALLDGLVVAALLFLFTWLFAVEPVFYRYYLYLGGVTLALVFVTFHSANLYRPWRGANLMRLVRRVFLSWGLVAVILIFLGYLTKTSHIFSRKVALTWLAVTPVVLIGLRLNLYLGLRWVRAHGRNSRTAVIAGAGDLGRRLGAHMVDVMSLGIRLEGFFDDHPPGPTVTLPGGHSYPVLGGLDDMADYVRHRQINMVYLALPLRAEERVKEIIDQLQDTTASVYFAPDIFIFSLLQANFTDLRGIPLISLWETPFFGVNGWLKRAEDILLASLILVVISPVLLAIAAGIKLTSPGPVIFKQRRYGLDGREILIYKFRTMTVCEDGPDIPQATRSDCRVTRFGRFLRRSSLDELPQFFNVLQGTMSIVGPRPHAVAHNELYRKQIPGYMLRHKVRPGITGWAQINGWRGETDTLEKMEKRLEYDLEYLRRWSLGLDLKIILVSLFKGWTGSQAY